MTLFQLGFLVQAELEYSEWWWIGKVKSLPVLVEGKSSPIINKAISNSGGHKFIGAFNNMLDICCVYNTHYNMKSYLL